MLLPLLLGAVAGVLLAVYVIFVQRPDGPEDDDNPDGDRA